MPYSIARILGTCLAGLLAWPTLSSAAQPGWYFGVSFGGTKYDMDDTARQIDSDLVFSGSFATSSTTVRDDADSGLKGYFGYNFSRFLGIEIGYANLGEAILQTVTTGPADLFVGQVEVHGWQTNLVASLPLGLGFAAHVKGGPFAWKQEGLLPSLSGTDAITGKFDGFDWSAGAGISYEVVKGMALRVEFERFKVDDDEVDYVSSGLLFSF
jgi:opacity protein-like surface antigen